MTVARVEVTGLKQLLRDVRKVERDLPKSMRQALIPVSKSVHAKARGRAQSQGGVAAHAVKRGLRSGATQNSAWIKLVATREPTILGAEFGGGRRRTTRQFQPWRGSGGGAGYFVYPTIRGESNDIATAVEESIGALLRSAGFT